MGQDVESKTSSWSENQQQDVQQSKPDEKVTNEDEKIQNWDGPNDPEHPLNWSTNRKVVIFGIVWIFTFLTPLASSMFAPGLPEVMESFDISSDLYGSWVLSVYILGYAFGPLVVGPLSELYGRSPVYHVSNSFFTIFLIACAVSSSMGMLAGFRFLAGLAGSGPITLGAGTISDIIPIKRRGLIVAIWALGPLIGPAIGPVAGGFFAQAKGWRWVFWLLAIVSGFFLLVSFVFMRETHPPTLLRQKAKKLRKAGNERNAVASSGLSVWRVLLTSIARPLQMLLFSPIVLSLTLYITYVYGIYYIFLTTITRTFEEIYGFTEGTVGLAYIGLGIGACGGMLVCGHVSDVMMRRQAKNGGMKPEYRLPPTIPGSLFTPIGLFWFGWSVAGHVHWIMPIIGTVFIGIGLAAAMMTVNYLVDAFPKYAASAVAANTVLRSVGGALLPLAGPSLYRSLGQGWGNSLLAFLTLLLCPVSIVLYKYGEQLRLRSRFAAEP